MSRAISLLMTSPPLTMHFAGLGVDNVLRRHVILNTGGQRQLLIELVAAHAHQVIALGIEEQRIEQILVALSRVGGSPGFCRL